MKKKDFILIGFISIIILIGFGFNHYLNSYKSGKIEIYVNNKLYGTYDINAEEEIKIKTANSYNIIDIRNEGVQMKDASCPDKVCVNSGFINKNSESIVCLPNKVNIKIISDKYELENDAVAN